MSCFVVLAMPLSLNCSCSGIITVDSSDDTNNTIKQVAEFSGGRILFDWKANLIIGGGGEGLLLQYIVKKGPHTVIIIMMIEC